MKPSISNPLARRDILVIGFVITTTSWLTVSAFSPKLKTTPFYHQSTGSTSFRTHGGILKPRQPEQHERRQRRRLQQKGTYITTVFGIDFDALQEFDDECDFLDGDLSQVDLTKCLPAPSTSLPPDDAVSLCLDSLLVNNEPKMNAGLEVCWNFSSSNCRAGKLLYQSFECTMGHQTQNNSHYLSCPIAYDS